MQNIDLITGSINFVSGMTTNPKETLSDTFRGLKTGVSELEGFHKVTVPALLGLGTLLAFSGAATGDMVAVGLGTLESTGAAGIYQDIGHHLAHG